MRKKRACGDENEEVVHGVEVDEPGSGGRMLTGGGVRERERVGVGV